jgi:hypothetical protein
MGQNLIGHAFSLNLLEGPRQQGGSPSAEPP